MTTIPDPEKLATVLTERFGISLVSGVSRDDQGPVFDFRPADLHENEGFLIRTTVGWRSIVSHFEIGRFGAELLREMSRSSREQKNTFASLARELSGKDGKFRFRINGNQCNPLEPSTWPESWNGLELEIERTPVMIDHESGEDIGDKVLLWAGGLLGMVLSLLPLEEEISSGLPEGALRRVEVNRYERSRINRAICISVHGAQCKVCGLDFKERYGEIGRGFIHVHHIVPVSQMNTDYKIDPVSELVPVCPNCHSMLHRQNPPLLITELKQYMLENESEEN